MRAALKAGVQIAVAPTLYPTPRAVADRMVAALDLFPGAMVLEPSAGTGALVDAVEREWRVNMTAFEHDQALAMARGFSPLDFLAVTPASRYDRVIMNPPFNGGADVRHIQHAQRFPRPGGLLVAICADGPRQAKALADFEWLERLPSGTFNGTGVRSAIVRWRA